MSNKKVFNYVLGFLFSRDYDNGSVALISKTHPDWQAGKLNGIGGSINEGETPHQAMIREFHEEAGLLTCNWYNFAILSGHMNGDTTQEEFHIHCFCNEDNLSQLVTQTDENIVIIEVAHLAQYEHIYNLSWLLPMAQNRLSGPELAETFYIQENYKVRS